MARPDDSDPAQTGAPPDGVTSRLKAMREPLDNVAFPAATEALTGCKVLALDPSNADHCMLLDRLGKAASKAGAKARSQGIFTSRPNEAGNEIERFVISALRDEGFSAGIPVCASGKSRSAGYPDIAVSDGATNVYIDCKTYSRDTKDQTLRTFYLSPSPDPKITSDAYHLLMSFELRVEERKKGKAFVPARWGDIRA